MDRIIDEEKLCSDNFLPVFRLHPPRFTSITPKNHGRKTQSYQFARPFSQHDLNKTMHLSKIDQFLPDVLSGVVGIENEHSLL